MPKIGNIPYIVISNKGSSTELVFNGNTIIDELLGAMLNATKKEKVLPITGHSEKNGEVRVFHEGNCTIRIETCIHEKMILVIINSEKEERDTTLVRLNNIFCEG